MISINMACINYVMVLIYGLYRLIYSLYQLIYSLYRLIHGYIDLLFVSTLSQFVDFLAVLFTICIRLFCLFTYRRSGHLSTVHLVFVRPLLPLPLCGYGPVLVDMSGKVLVLCLYLIKKSINKSKRSNKKGKNE